MNEGKIANASFVEVSRQRNSRQENKQIKDDAILRSFRENPHHLSQKDTDACWARKTKSIILAIKTWLNRMPEYINPVYSYNKTILVNEIDE